MANIEIGDGMINEVERDDGDGALEMVAPAFLRAPDQ